MMAVGDRRALVILTRVFRITVLTGTVAVVLLAAVTCGSAQASPGAQWNLTAVPGPTVLNPAFAKNEVQQVTVSATSGEFVLLEETTFKYEFFKWDASAAEVQAGLEKMYGAGNVEVSGGPGDEEGTKPYVITFVGSLADQPVARINVSYSQYYLGCEGATGSGCQKEATLKETIKGRPAGQIVVEATNTGAAASDGSKLTLTDILPEGIEPRGFEGEYMGSSKFVKFEPMSCTPPVAGENKTTIVSCTYSKAVDVGQMLRMVIDVNLATGLPARLVDKASLIGGGLAGESSIEEPLAIGSGEAGFGIAPGSLFAAVSSVKAGAHPNLTTSFSFNEVEPNVAAGAPKNIEVEMPKGMLGDPLATPRCTIDEVIASTCPADTAVGSATVLSQISGTNEAEPHIVLVYNIEPEEGEPAALAFSVAGVANSRLDTSVQPGSGYRVRISISDVVERARVLSSSVTIWGVPAEHNGPGLSNTSGEHEASFGGPGSGVLVAFLRNPTQCGQEDGTDLSFDSWQGASVGPLLAPLPTMFGCESLIFKPSLDVSATSLQAGVPAGYTVNLGVPQNEDPAGVATPDVRDVEMAMPSGTVISPSSANGLAICSQAQLGQGSTAPGGCPEASKIGTVKITTPLLALPLEGSVYVGEPECSPCAPSQAADGKMVRLLIEAEGSGVRVKLAGRTKIDQATGRLTTVFTENPQQPFSKLQLSLKGGEDAPLVNPSTCGPIVATATITPWSASGPSEAANISAPAIPVEGCSPPGFSPSFTAGMTGSAQAGAFSPFAFTLSRPDGQQALGSVTLHMPPGLEGMVSKVTPCPEAQANAGTCPASSEIGSDTVVVGPGSQPYTIAGGKVFFTGPYRGEPFGLSIVTPTSAGPFTLAGNTGGGTEVVRASITVDPATAAITIASDPFPTVLDGIPLSIQKVIVNVSREGFMFNPTNCDPLSVGLTAASASNASVSGAYPLQAVDCATLPFKPKFAAATSGKTSRAKGASLEVKIAYPSGQAGLRAVKVKLPRQLPSRFETLQKACPDRVFNVDPAGCPVASRIGTASTVTPVLPVPLGGPVYFVSHGARKFPDLVIVMQGDGVTIVLDGETFISKNITSTTFRAIPDVPFSSFELRLPQGPFSALAAPSGVCKAKLVMPTRMVAQNGSVLTQNTPIKTAGCPKAKKRRKHGRKRRK